MSLLLGDQLRASLTIYQVLQILGIDFSGERQQQIRCPFHDDRSPSARIYPPPENRLYCFTCGERWDIIDLIRKKFGWDYAGATAYLASTFGIAGTDATAPVVQAQLRRPVVVAPGPALAQAEHHLRRARQTLDCASYFGLATALDTIGYQYGAGQMPAPEAIRLVREIVRRT